MDYQPILTTATVIARSESACPPLEGRGNPVTPAPSAIIGQELNSS